MPLEQARVELSTLDAELRRSRRSDRFRGTVALLLLAGLAYMTFGVLPSIRAGVERADCARAIADETSEIKDRADGAFRGIVILAFRLPAGSANDPAIQVLVTKLEAADTRLALRKPNQQLVEERCPGV